MTYWIVWAINTNHIKIWHSKDGDCKYLRNNVIPSLQVCLWLYPCLASKILMLTDPWDGCLQFIVNRYLTTKPKLFSVGAVALEIIDDIVQLRFRSNVWPKYVTASNVSAN